MNKATDVEFKASIQKGETLFRDKTKQKEAYAHFKKMAQHYPSNSYFKIRLAELSINFKKWDEALELTSILIQEKSPKYFSFQFHATVLIKKGFFIEAETLLDKMTKLFPDKQKQATNLFLLRNMKTQITKLRQLLS